VEGIGADDLRRFVELYAQRLAERKGELTELDAQIGDADHGINMDRGFSAATAKVAALEGADPAAVCKTVAMTLISTVGGAAGPLYGTFFLRMATSLGDAATVSVAELGDALRAGLDGVRQRGRAEMGDKTMVDAMWPAVDAYQAALGNSDLATALRAAADAAGKGCEAATPLVARKGRASYLGERSAGHQDPGATSTTILFESLRDALVPA
jgi:dihydroxyacetone kinase-like protein